MKINFENRLFELRKRNSLSQEQLGEILGVTKSVISDWENGKKFPTKRNLEKICDYFNVTISYLFGGNDLGEDNTIDISTLSDDEKNRWG